MLSERIGTALVNGNWFTRRLQALKGRVVLMHGHRHIDRSGKCAGLSIVSAPSPVMEATDDADTYFYIHALAAQSGGQFGSLPPERVVVNARYPADSWTSGMHCWQGCPDAFREIGCAISGSRRLVNQGTPPEFIKRQCRVNPARVVEVAVDQTIKKMADVEPAGSSGGIRVADDVDRAAVGEQVI